MNHAADAAWAADKKRIKGWLWAAVGLAVAGGIVGAVPHLPAIAAKAAVAPGGAMPTP